MSEIEIIGVDMSPFVRTCRIACEEKASNMTSHTITNPEWMA